MGSTSVQTDILDRNLESAFWSKMGDAVGGTQVLLDPRMLGVYIEIQARTTNELQLIQNNMHDDVQEMVATIKELHTIVEGQNEKIKELTTMLRIAMGRTDTNTNIAEDSAKQEGLAINAIDVETGPAADQQAFPTYSLPERLKDMDIKDSFQQWHFQQWHTQIRRGRTKQRGILSQLRFGIEYFSLFLPEQVPPLPPSIGHPMELSAESWRRQIRFLANKAFDAVTEFSWSRV